MEVHLVSLWLPILVSALVVFAASFLAWSVLPHHKPDITSLEHGQEQQLLEWAASAGIKSGVYMFPGCADAKRMRDPEFRKRWKAGPWGTLNLLKAPPSFARNLICVFLFFVVVGVFVAYVGGIGMRPRTPFLHVFRVTGAAAVMAHALGFIPHGIFFGRSFRSMFCDVVDGVVYGLLTGLIFAWLWPAAEAVMSDPPVGG